MNRRIIALMLVAILLLAACGKKNTAETTEPGLETTEATISTLPGIVYTPENIGGALTEEEDTTPTSEATEPKEETTPTIGEETEPTEGEEQNPTEAPVVPTTEYERYNAMSGEEQEAFIDSFESIQAFMDWYNAAKAEYDALHPGIDIGDGNIDAGDLIGGNG